MKGFLMVFCLMFLTNNSVLSQVDDVDSVIAYMLSPDLMTPKSLSCDDIQTRYDVVKVDLTSYTSRIFSGLKSENAIQLPEHASNSIDARYQINIYQKNKSLVRVCFSGNAPQDIIYIEGKYYKLKNMDVKYILDSIYDKNIDLFFEKD